MMVPDSPPYNQHIFPQPIRAAATVPPQWRTVPDHACVHGLALAPCPPGALPPPGSGTPAGPKWRGAGGRTAQTALQRRRGEWHGRTQWGRAGCPHRLRWNKERMGGQRVENKGEWDGEKNPYKRYGVQNWFRSVFSSPVVRMYLQTGFKPARSVAWFSRVG